MDIGVTDASVRNAGSVVQPKSNYNGRYALEAGSRCKRPCCTVVCNAIKLRTSQADPTGGQLAAN